MLLRITPLRTRRAAVAPIAALLMTFLVGMLTFSIDIGYICSVQAELQDAADAAALAGAAQLQTPFVAYYAPGQTNQKQIYLTATGTTDPLGIYPSSFQPPTPTAQQYAAYNQAGGTYINVPASDISFSFYDGTTFSAPSYAMGLFPNTINVTTRRDNVANGALGLFFGQVFGISTVNLTATASATIFNGLMTSATTNPPFYTSGNGSGTTPTIQINAHILPVALDINVWNNYSNGNFVFENGAFVSSTSPYLTSNNITVASNGLPQLHVYPNNTNTPGSFGLIDVGVPSNNVPAFRNWIDDGQTPNDIGYLLKNNLLPVSLSNPAPWKVGPGMKSTLVTNFQSVMGDANLIPLFTPSSPLPTYVAASGTGQGATYAVVGFAGVTITQATGSGSSMDISIQPSAIVDPTAVIPYAMPAASIAQQSSFSSWPSSYSASSLSQFGPAFDTFVPAKLTR